MDKQELLLLLLVAAPFIGHQGVSCATLSVHSGSHWGCSSSNVQFPMQTTTKKLQNCQQESQKKEKKKENNFFLKTPAKVG